MIPLLADNEVMDRIRPVLEEGAALSPFEARSLERKVEGIIHADPKTGWVLKAYLAAARWDVAGAWAAVQNALRLAGSKPPHFSISGVLTAIVELEDAAAHAVLAAQAAPSDRACIEGAIDLLTAVGRWEDAVGVAAAYVALVEKQDPTALPLATSLRDKAAGLVSAFESLEVPWERLRWEMQAAAAVLRARKRRFVGQSIYLGVDEDAEIPYVAYQFVFDGSLEDEFELEAELAERMVASPGWEPSRLSVELLYRGGSGV